MLTSREEQIVFASGVEQVHGMLYLPRESNGTGILFCHPLFEERKSAQRTMVETARAACEAGFSVLRFDYRGCGNSGGEFRDFSVGDWLHDIRAAEGVLKTRTSSSTFGLLGLRLGATLAALAAAQSEAGFLVAWEPVIDGAAYFKQELRKKLMKQMVTHGRSQDTRDALSGALARGQDIDFDGFCVTPRLHDDVSAVDLRQAVTGLNVPVRLSAVTHSGEPGPLLKQWEAVLKGGGAAVEMHACRLPPFWNLIGIADCTELIEDTCAWLTHLNNPLIS